MGLQTMDCGENPAPFDECGWNELKGFYDCGGSGSDPTGQNPVYCPTVVDDIVEETQVTPECKVGTLYAVGCQSVPWEGCCGDDGLLFFCEAGQYLCYLDCSVLLPPADVCGWHAGVNGYYDCGGDGEDPSGEFPLSCPPLQIEEDVVSPDVPSTEEACPGIPATGCCQGSLVVWCESGQESSVDCTSLAEDPIFADYVHCGTNSLTGKADCLKKPDPSPPECSTEPKPDTVEPGGQEEGGVEPVPDFEARAEVRPDVSESPGEPGAAGDDLIYRNDGSGIIIPVEVEPPPKKKKSGRCSVGAAPGAQVVELLLLLVLLLSCLGLMAREAR